MKTKLSIGFYVNATLIVITIGISLLLWIQHITINWNVSGWDERVMYILLPSHALALIFRGAHKMWRLKQNEKKDGIRRAENGEVIRVNDTNVKHRQHPEGNKRGIGQTIREA